MAGWCRRAIAARYEKYARDEAVPAADAILCVTGVAALAGVVIWGVRNVIALFL